MKTNTNINLNYYPLPDLTINKKDNLPIKLKLFISSFVGAVIFFVSSLLHRKFLLKSLLKISIIPEVISNIHEAKSIGYYLVLCYIKKGFIDKNKKYAIICENDLFENKKDIFKENNYYNELDNLDGLKENQLLVHIKYGIGKFRGLKILENKGITAEYLSLEYADNTKLYVPINSLNLIKKYVNKSNTITTLHSLGNLSWQRIRNKTIIKIKDIAVDLLETYAKRASQIGFSFKLNSKKYQNFCNSFPFNLTLDQESAINQVFYDMIKPIPMDRIVCGDVGFGKTEVAMRAAFIAIENNKQVAILTPTTLLAQQHFDNFKKRFKNWKVNIEMLSRFRSKKEEKNILNYIDSGKVKILIGTHKILKKNINWCNLGLLIVDEEHRFGVSHKDRIKKIKPNIDVLTLTATPIPRTLNMAMNGIRDLSIISTPPENRLEIKTFICEYDKHIIRKSILQEISRGGQVYYLYNDVENIKKSAQILQKLVPEANIAIGHGQMRERELEMLMNDFYHNRFNVLVCTTIIETGIDIANANTIIIERADQFGLAQLHQLRGRVGRSNQQAYAWLLTPRKQGMTENAQKRLEAISALEKLGSGLTLSIQDLEIRGSGEILGEIQSGQIETLGFNMYMEMLNKAILSIKEGNKTTNLDEKETEIELQLTSIIPSTFISNVNTRLSFYKKISNACSEKEIYEIKYVLISKFGKLPEESENLINLAILKLNAKILGIKRIQFKKNSGFIEFNDINKINYNFLVYLLKKQPKHWKIENSNLRLSFFNKKIYKNKIKWIKMLLVNLTNNTK